MAEPPAKDDELLWALRERGGRETAVVLRDGRRLTVYDIAWGYDLGDEWAHVTTNISPGFQDAAIDVFSTDEVVRLVDPTTDEAIYTV